jgi:hypothetical protein
MLGDDFETVSPGIDIQTLDDMVQSMINQDMTYIPDSLIIELQQRAQAIIEYIGGYVYVPPSSDPNYKGK